MNDFAVREEVTYHKSDEAIDMFCTMLEMIASVPINVSATRSILDCMLPDMLRHVQKGMTELSTMIETVLTERESNEGNKNTQRNAVIGRS